MAPEWFEDEGRRRKPPPLFLPCLPPCRRLRRAAAGDGDAADAARYLAELWTRTNGLNLKVAAGAAAAGSDAETHSIVFRRRSGFAREAYAIEVTPQHI